MFGSEINGGLLSLLLPPGISLAIWSHLSLEERRSLLRELSLGSGDGGQGSVLYVLNPLRVRQRPGLNGEIIAYAKPGTEVTRTGPSRMADGGTWYRVSYVDDVTGIVVIGWVNRYFLEEDGSRVGFPPSRVGKDYVIQTNAVVQAAGGRLMRVDTNYLQISDGPTSDYAVQEAPEWGHVVRWTGRSLDEGSHTWYEVKTWRELPDESLEAVTGWAREDRLKDYVPEPGAPQVEGNIWIPLKQERSFSYYTVADIDAYTAVDHSDPWLDRNASVTWKNGDPGFEVPNGALFSAEGVAMQGSGKVTVDGKTMYIQLDNPRDLHWDNAEGDLTEWTGGSWSTGPPVRINNPEAAKFRWDNTPPSLTSGVSLAGPPSMRGESIWVPELKSESNPEGVFVVEDAGGAFPEGSLRVDLFFEDPEQGLQWYSQYCTERLQRGGDPPAFTLQELPPPIEEVANP